MITAIYGIQNLIDNAMLPEGLEMKALPDLSLKLAEIVGQSLDEFSGEQEFKILENRWDPAQGTNVYSHDLADVIASVNQVGDDEIEMWCLHKRHWKSCETVPHRLMNLVMDRVKEDEGLKSFERKDVRQLVYTLLRYGFYAYCAYRSSKSTRGNAEEVLASNLEILAKIDKQIRQQDRELGRGRRKRKPGKRRKNRRRGGSNKDGKAQRDKRAKAMKGKDGDNTSKQAPADNAFAQAEEALKERKVG